jgi:hypothetical protein
MLRPLRKSSFCSHAFSQPKFASFTAYGNVALVSANVDVKVKNPNKQMLKDLIKKITIDEDKRVRIYFNFNLNEEV